MQISFLGNDCVLDPRDVARDSPVEPILVTQLELGVSSFSQRQRQLIIFFKLLSCLSDAIIGNGWVVGWQPGSLNLSGLLWVFVLVHFTTQTSSAPDTLFLHGSWCMNSSLSAQLLFKLEGLTHRIQILPHTERSLRSGSPVLLIGQFGPSLEGEVTGSLCLTTREVEVSQVVPVDHLENGLFLDGVHLGIHEILLDCGVFLIKSV